MKTILCFGDSNTWGFIPESFTEPFARRYAPNERWTGVLAKALGDGWRVIEEGQNGRTTVHEDPFFPSRNGKVYLPACLESHKPIDLVILMLGTNDLKSIHNLPPSEIANGASVLAKMILKSEVGPGNRAPRLLLLCPPAVGDLSHLPELEAKIPNGTQRSAQFPRYYSTVAQALGCAYFNTQEIISPSKVDGLHLDKGDHERLGLELAEKVRSLDL